MVAMMAGVLTGSMLDDGRGSARSKVRFESFDTRMDLSVGRSWYSCHADDGGRSHALDAGRRPWVCMLQGAALTLFTLL